MITEFGEEVTREEVKEITERVRVLTSEEIDVFFFECGWIDKDKGNNKALPDWRIESIKKKYRFAENFVRALIMETPYKEVLDALFRAEERYNKTKA